MCTATFLPIANHSYLFTHNRDEKISRSIALPPRKFIVNSIPVFMPKDKESNGTWIACSSCVFSLCILNGANNFHESKPPYRQSRGQIIVDFFNYGNVFTMADNYNWQGIEPFTLIVVQHVNAIVHLYQMVWDGIAIDAQELNASIAHIWSSSTLYTQAQKRNRQKWFDDLIKEYPIITKEKIISFHEYNPDGEEEGFIIDRKQSARKTVSITNIENLNNEFCSFYYHDLINDKKEIIRIYK